ncbi:hypothetical protein C5167_028109 [Papaver somniferum]|nr:hypothetical protein C5167_028109 [Papaver somniferum]
MENPRKLRLRELEKRRSFLITVDGCNFIFDVDDVFFVLYLQLARTGFIKLSFLEQSSKMKETIAQPVADEVLMVVSVDLDDG